MRINATPLIAALTLFVAGCSKSESFDLGEVKNGTYHNQFFGLTVSLPHDWKVADREFLRKFNEERTKRMAGRDKEIAGAELLFVTKYPIGAAVPVNPSITCFASNTEDTPYKSGEEYLEDIMKSFQGGSTNFKVVQKPTRQSIAGRQAGAMEIDLLGGSTTLHQLYLMVPIKGYAVGFLATYERDDDGTIDHALQSIKFEE